MNIEDIEYKFCTMTDRELAEYIDEYNAWRRGDDNIAHPHPKELGIALKHASDRIRRIHDIEISVHK